MSGSAKRPRGVGDQRPDVDRAEWFSLRRSQRRTWRRQDHTLAIGASAFDCLLKRLRGDTEPTRTLDFLPQLIIRGSTTRRQG